MKTLLKLVGLVSAILLLFTPNKIIAESSSILNFSDEEVFSILIIADPQDTNHPQKAMIELLNASLDEAKPQLVVFLGDMIHGPSVHGVENVKSAIHAIVQPVVDRNIPFALVFGNHDDQCGLTKEEQLAIYQSYSGCLAVEGDNIPGCGNYYLVIDNPLYPDAPIILWFLDSGTYAEQGKGTYGYVTEEQNAWMIRRYETLRNQYQNAVSYVFQHIPVPQVYDMLIEVPFGTNGAVTCYGPNFGKWYIVNDDYIWDGKLGEGPCSSEYDSGEFEAWKAMNLRAAFFGHDHFNDYCGTLDGIDMIATSGIGFYMYGRGDEHGSRIVTFNASNPKEYNTKMLYYKEIVSTPLPALFVPTLGVLIQQYVFTGLAILFFVILLLVILIRKKKRRKKHAQTK